jgi:hypothetical protein
MLRKKKSIFVEINFAEKKKKPLISFSFKETYSLKERNYFLYTLSALSFIGIFVVSFLTHKIVQNQIEDNKQIQENIEFTTQQIAQLKRKIRTKQKEFEKFYITNLKEKLLFVLFTKRFKDKIEQAAAEFKDITDGLNAYLGFAIYPNLYTKFSSEVPFMTSLNQYYGIKFINFETLFGRTSSPFNNPQKFNIPIVLNPTVYIYTEKSDSKFEQAIQNIKDETLKANIRLEYLLIKRGLKNLTYRVPATIIFPLNMVFPTTSTYEEKLDKLKQFCNAIFINRSYSETKFLNNKLHIRAVIDGVCVKNIY